MAVKRGEGGKFTKKAVAQGVGDSKIFAAPEGSFPPPEIDIQTCHVAGIPVMNLPLEAQQRILYQQTDEGIEWWAANRHRLENRDNNPRFGQRATSVDQQVAEFRDGTKAGMQPWEVPDPLREVRDAHKEPGFRYRFLSPHKLARDGKRGWEIVQRTLKNGVKEAVTLGNMLLGKMPEDVARSREQYMEQKSRDQMVAAEEAVHESQEQIMSAARLSGVARRRGIETRDQGLESVRGDEREMDDRDFSPANY